MQLQLAESWMADSSLQLTQPADAIGQLMAAHTTPAGGCAGAAQHCITHGRAGDLGAECVASQRDGGAGQGHPRAGSRRQCGRMSARACSRSAADKYYEDDFEQLSDVSDDGNDAAKVQCHCACSRAPTFPGRACAAGVPAAADRAGAARGGPAADVRPGARAHVDHGQAGAAADGGAAGTWRRVAVHVARSHWQQTSTMPCMHFWSARARRARPTPPYTRSCSSSTPRRRRRHCSSSTRLCTPRWPAADRLACNTQANATPRSSHASLSVSANLMSSTG